MYSVGIDIGSTATKAVVLQEEEIATTLLFPTGFSSVDIAEHLLQDLVERGYCQEDCLFTATGYGRVSVPYANKTITEITCHGKGADYLFGDSGVVIDIGGQDTKIIEIESGKVCKFVMNDKCSAGTGKFLEVMTNRLGLSQNQLTDLARIGAPTSISSMCTVFAESEIISLIGKGEPRENIAYGVIESIVEKVTTLAVKVPGQQYFLTGGLCENDYVIERLKHHLKSPVISCPQARYAGALGAALLGQTQENDTHG